MDLAQHILSLIATLGILVTVHEFGHFWVARRCGIKVLRFSVGFGQPIFVRKDKLGTEFAVAAIPLGGYVKMLDEREAPVSAEDLPYAFNRKPVMQRIAVVLAGPAANFIFAIFAYWLLYVLGFTALVPKLGQVTPESPAAYAGVQAPGEITAVDGSPVATWQDVGLNLLSRLGDSGEITISVLPDRTEVARDYRIDIRDWLAEREAPDPIVELGLVPFRPPIPPVVGALAENEPAILAGLQSGDRILGVDDQSVKDWAQFVEVVQASPNKRIEVTLIRHEQTLNISLTPRDKELENGKRVGFIGAGVAPFSPPSDLLRHISYDPVTAIPKAFSRTWDDTVMTLDAIKKMLVGLVSVKNLSGPITIARVATTSISSGLEDFLRFLALLSVSLGVLNLLPIPVLDGGHLLYYAVELVRGRPLSEKIQMLGLRVGIGMILLLMLVAFYNDLARL